MSRIGNQPVEIPQEVKAGLRDGELIVSGPKGELTFRPRPEVGLKIEGNQILVSRKREDRFARAYHGLSRALIANMIKGVSEGYSKVLKIIGTGFRVSLQGEKITLSLGLSHPVIFEAPPGIKLEVEGNDTIKISGPDKGLVGQTAAKIRAIKPPEPYKGKGIRYEDEVVKKKLGKAGKAGVAGGFAGG